MKKRPVNQLVKLFKDLVCLLIFLMASVIGFSQSVGISDPGAVQPNAAAGLDVNFATKGLLIPRVALVSFTSPMPLATTTLAAGMIVYNASPNLNVFPGLYIYDGTKWVAASPKATVNGELQYWNGTSWVAISPGTTGQRLQVNASGIPVWGP